MIHGSSKIMVPGVNLRSYCFFFSFGLDLFNCLFTQSFRYVQDTSIKLLISKSSNVYVLDKSIERGMFLNRKYLESVKSPPFIHLYISYLLSFMSLK